MLLTFFFCFRSSVGDSNRRIKFTLMFSDWSWELPFMRRPDPLFSFYVFGAFLVLMGIMTIQLVLYQTYFQTMSSYTTHS